MLESLGYEILIQVSIHASAREAIGRYGCQDFLNGVSIHASAREAMVVW